MADPIAAIDSTTYPSWLERFGEFLHVHEESVQLRAQMWKLMLRLAFGLGVPLPKLSARLGAAARAQLFLADDVVTANTKVSAIRQLKAEWDSRPHRSPIERDATHAKLLTATLDALEAFQELWARRADRLPIWMPWFALASCAPLSVTDDGCKVTNLASGALQIAMVSPVFSAGKHALSLLCTHPVGEATHADAAASMFVGVCAADEGKTVAFAIDPFSRVILFIDRRGASAYHVGESQAPTSTAATATTAAASTATAAETAVSSASPLEARSVAVTIEVDAQHRAVVFTMGDRRLQPIECRLPDRLRFWAGIETPKAAVAVTECVSVSEPAAMQWRRAGRFGWVHLKNGGQRLSPLSSRAFVNEIAQPALDEGEQAALVSLNFDVSHGRPEAAELHMLMMEAVLKKRMESSSDMGGEEDFEWVPLEDGSGEYHLARFPRVSDEMSMWQAAWIGVCSAEWETIARGFSDTFLRDTRTPRGSADADAGASLANGSPETSAPTLLPVPLSSSTTSAASAASAASVGSTSSAATPSLPSTASPANSTAAPANPSSAARSTSSFTLDNAPLPPVPFAPRFTETDPAAPATRQSHTTAAATAITDATATTATTATAAAAAAAPAAVEPDEDKQKLGASSADEQLPCAIALNFVSGALHAFYPDHSSKLLKQLFEPIAMTRLVTFRNAQVCIQVSRASGKIHFRRKADVGAVGTAASAQVRFPAGPLHLWAGAHMQNFFARIDASSELLSPNSASSFSDSDYVGEGELMGSDNAGATRSRLRNSARLHAGCASSSTPSSSTSPGLRQLQTAPPAKSPATAAAAPSSARPQMAQASAELAFPPTASPVLAGAASDVAANATADAAATASSGSRAHVAVGPRGHARSSAFPLCPPPQYLPTPPTPARLVEGLVPHQDDPRMHSARPYPHAIETSDVWRGMRGVFFCQGSQQEDGAHAGKAFASYTGWAYAVFLDAAASSSACVQEDCISLASRVARSMLASGDTNGHAELMRRLKLKLFVGFATALEAARARAAHLSMEPSLGVLYSLCELPFWIGGDTALAHAHPHAHEHAHAHAHAQQLAHDHTHAHAHATTSSATPSHNSSTRPTCAASPSDGAQASDAATRKVVGSKRPSGPHTAAHLGTMDAFATSARNGRMGWVDSGAASGGAAADASAHSASQSATSAKRQSDSALDGNERKRPFLVPRAPSFVELASDDSGNRSRGIEIASSSAGIASSTAEIEDEFEEDEALSSDDEPLQGDTPLLPLRSPATPVVLSVPPTAAATGQELCETCSIFPEKGGPSASATVGSFDAAHRGARRCASCGDLLRGPAATAARFWGEESRRNDLAPDPSAGAQVQRRPQQQSHRQAQQQQAHHHQPQQQPQPPPPPPQSAPRPQRQQAEQPQQQLRRRAAQPSASPPLHQPMSRLLQQQPSQLSQWQPSSPAFPSNAPRSRLGTSLIGDPMMPHVVLAWSDFNPLKLAVTDAPSLAHGSVATRRRQLSRRGGSGDAAALGQPCFDAGVHALVFRVDASAGNLGDLMVGLACADPKRASREISAEALHLASGEMRSVRGRSGRDSDLQSREVLPALRERAQGALITMFVDMKRRRLSVSLNGGPLWPTETTLPATVRPFACLRHEGDTISLYSASRLDLEPPLSAANVESTSAADALCSSLHDSSQPAPLEHRARLLVSLPTHAAHPLEARIIGDGGDSLRGDVPASSVPGERVRRGAWMAFKVRQYQSELWCELRRLHAKQASAESGSANGRAEPCPDVDVSSVSTRLQEALRAQPSAWLCSRCCCPTRMHRACVICGCVQSETGGPGHGPLRPNTAGSSVSERNNHHAYRHRQHQALQQEEQLQQHAERFQQPHHPQPQPPSLPSSFQTPDAGSTSGTLAQSDLNTRFAAHASGSSDANRPFKFEVDDVGESFSSVHSCEEPEQPELVAKVSSEVAEDPIANDIADAIGRSKEGQRLSARLDFGAALECFDGAIRLLKSALYCSSQKANAASAFAASTSRRRMPEQNRGSTSDLCEMLPELYCRKAWALLKLQRHTEALEASREAAAFRPLFGRTLCLSALALRGLRRDEEAQAALALFDRLCQHEVVVELQRPMLQAFTLFCTSQPGARQERPPPPCSQSLLGPLASWPLATWPPTSERRPLLLRALENGDIKDELFGALSLRGKRALCCTCHQLRALVQGCLRAPDLAVRIEDATFENAAYVGRLPHLVRLHVQGEREPLHVADLRRMTRINIANLSLEAALFAGAVLSGGEHTVRLSSGSLVALWPLRTRERLNLSSRDLKDPDLAVLLGALSLNRCLKELDLYDNPAPESSVLKAAMIAALPWALLRHHPFLQLAATGHPLHRIFVVPHRLVVEAQP